MSFIDKMKENRRHKQEEDSVLDALEQIIDEREERGEQHLVDQREIPMLKNIFRLRDMRVHNIMTPRVDMAAVSLNITAAQLNKSILKEKFTRYPVFDGSLDNIVGILNVKDVLFALMKKKKAIVADLMKPDVLFVSPAMRALDLLKEMQSRQSQMAIVIDEHGGADGLVSMEDLLEMIVGEIDDEHDEPGAVLIEEVKKGVIEADAKARLEAVEALLGPIATPEERDNPDIDTIGGWVANLAGRVPAKGEVIHHPASGFRFTILSSDPSHIRRIRITGSRKKQEEKP